MNKRMLWSRILCVVGFVMMAGGAIVYVVDTLSTGYYHDLLPGALAIGTAMDVFTGVFDPRSPRWLLLTGLTLPGSALVALGAFLGNSRYRKLLYAALVLTACGLIVGFFVYLGLLTESINGPNPRWAFVTYAYPIGGIMSLVGALVVIVEPCRRPRTPKDSVGET
ncbi:hypothetical protein [Candidatus Cryosericum terrychapinii]|jgi:hypothetical protein|uniref:Uncharacterized protein n=1 Tax=Candidatus Cryosericum terrychapinii TaxID=2290919 RepID=A0A398D3S8_9BACT|nr:hypothetical protein [Candidatus Cryosericum terrychapinii]RIE05734.1 hypothetical protein SMC7_06155 [Candidatus Cryosericum terrychapinii]